MRDPSKKYVFFSYAHSGDDISDLVEWFEKSGYNFIYDDVMLPGENWEIKAFQFISSPNCAGVLFLTSRNFLGSSPVMSEVVAARGYNKNSACLSLENCALGESARLVVGQAEKNISEMILKSFPKEEIYTYKRNVLTGADSGKLLKVLDAWGVEKQEVSLTEIVADLSSYTSDIPGEEKRLQNQKQGYYEFDTFAIAAATENFPSDYPITVLDLGCSDGSVGVSRFSDTRFDRVIGVDYNPKDVEKAKKAGYDPKFDFITLNLASPDLEEELRTELAARDVKKVDLIFMALTLHHLKNPTELLRKLFDVLQDDGVILIRGSDDGGKLCYPESELLRDFLSKYDVLVKGVSDRCNGRKLYKQLSDAGFVKIKMLYNTVDTCEKNRSEKEHLYNVGFGFREARLKEAVAKNTNPTVVEEANALLEMLINIKELFCTRDFWYANTSYIAIARKNP